MKNSKKSDNQCLSDNADKKFTLEDIKKAFDRGEWEGAGKSEIVRNNVFNSFIQSLTKQEYFCELEWKCSICGGKNFHKLSCKDTRRIENFIIDNNSVKVIKIWK